MELLRGTLARGGVLVVPTESSYALSVDPGSRSGVEAVFRIKGRAADQPLPVIIPGVSTLASLGVELPAAGLRGLEQGWPGPLSLLLRCEANLPASAGSGYLAVRVPGHERLLSLLMELDCALTATSANRSGEPALLETDAVAALLVGEDAMIVEGGRLPGGAPSTLVVLKEGRAVILREGRVSRRELETMAPDWFSAEAVEIPVEESR